MATYKQYENTKGRFWLVRGYLGIDPVTQKQINIEKRGFKTKKEAQIYFTREVNKFNSGGYGGNENKNKNPTYLVLYNEWLEQYKNTVKESTFVKTKQLFSNNILPIFGNLKIKNITSSFLQKTVNKWHKKFNQYRKVYNYTCKVFDYALVHGYIADNPKTRVVVPTVKRDYNKKERKKTFYNKSELQEVLEAIKHDGSLEWYCFFRALAFTGLRRGEMLALTWADINFNDKTLTVNKSLSVGENNRLIVQSPKTEASNRTISLDEKTLAIFKRWRSKQASLLLAFGFNALDSKQLVFCKLDCNKHYYLNKPRSVLTKIVEDNNLPLINIHGFRHTHCSLLFEAGIPIKDVQFRLGHSDMNTTMNIYAHVTDESKEKSAELFQAYVNF